MKEILNYQEIDMKLKQLNEEIFNNSDRKNALKMQNFLKDCQSKLSTLTKNTENLSKDFLGYKSVYDKMIGNIDVINKNVATQDDKKLNSLIDANDSINENLAKLDTEINNILKSCESIKADYNSIMKNARTAKANMDKYKTAFNKYKDEKESQIVALQKSLKVEGEKVEKSILAKYKTKSLDKMPVFVNLVSGRCGGCRMEVSVVSQNKLKSQKYVECENCGRYIFID